jgi:predicted 3-demethylubiquinone-9 3-methyltransferase (glyoxalase superfamily)
MASVQKITPSLWFEDKCEEAMNFYVSVFPDSSIDMTQHYPDQSEDPNLNGMQGKVLTGIFKLAGQRFQALDGGPLFKFNEAISFSVECETQEEIDHYWENLSAVPESEQCGWCKDKYGVSWQIVPKQLGELMGSDDPEKTGRVMQAFMQMKKFDIAKLQEAYDGK